LTAPTLLPVYVNPQVITSKRVGVGVCDADCVSVGDCEGVLEPLWDAVWLLVDDCVAVSDCVFVAVSD